MFLFLQEAVRMPPKLAAIFFKMFGDVSRHAYKESEISWHTRVTVELQANKVADYNMTAN
jgi:hypothetical protein